MPDTLRRLAIHVSGADGTLAAPDVGSPSTVDLLLPADCPVAVLIPPIVDVVLNGSATATAPQRWRLTHIGGRPLDTSMTLLENTVHDGDMLLLTTETVSAPDSRPGDSSSVVVAATGQMSTAMRQGTLTAAGIAVTAVSAAALALTGDTAGTSMHLWAAAVLSAASAGGAVMIGRATPQLRLTLSLAAVIFGVVTGFLAGPGAPWAPAVLLTASSGFAVSILMLHLTGGNTALLTALAAAAGVIAVVGAIGVTTKMPFGTAGAILTVLSLAVLSAAPKLSVAVAGLGPSRPEIGGGRAGLAHQVLTGLVSGWSSSAMLGAVTVAAVAVPESVPPESVPPAVAAMFAADVGLLLLLRQRTHVDAHRRLALGVAGLCALTAALVVTVSASPEHASWLCGAGAVAGIAAAGWTARTTPPNPVVRQCLHMLECLALAAVVPLAAWVMGMYSLAGTLSLP